MLYPVKGFGIVNETHVDISLFFNCSFRYHSDHKYCISCTSILYKTTLFYSNFWSECAAYSFHDNPQNEFGNVAHQADGSIQLTFNCSWFLGESYEDWSAEFFWYFPSVINFIDDICYFANSILFQRCYFCNSHIWPGCVFPSFSMLLVPLILESLGHPCYLE